MKNNSIKFDQYLNDHHNLIDSITKEYKLKNEILNGLQDDHEQLVKERDVFKKQQNILNNELKIIKMNNNKINNIKINNNIKMQKNLKLKDTIDNLTKEKNNLQEKNFILQKQLNEIEIKKYRSKSTNKTKLNTSKVKIPHKKKFHGLVKIKNKPIIIFSQTRKTETNKRMNNVVKKRKFILEISDNISIRFFGGLEEKKKKQKEEENELLYFPQKRKKITEKISEKIIKKDENEDKKDEKEKIKNSEEENEEDSEEELMRELEKIKREQAEENKRKNEVIKEKMEKEMISLNEKKEEKETENSIGISFDLNNNNYSSFSLSKPEEFSLKKKWYEESLFKNQSRKVIKPKKRFINDSVHSDFHYIFLDKAIQ